MHSLGGYGCGVAGSCGRCKKEEGDREGYEWNSLKVKSVESMSDRSMESILECNFSNSIFMRLPQARIKVRSIVAKPDYLGLYMLFHCPRVITDVSCNTPLKLHPSGSISTMLYSLGRQRYMSVDLDLLFRLVRKRQLSWPARRKSPYLGLINY